MKGPTPIHIFLASCLLVLFADTTIGAAPGDIVFERQDKAEVEIFPPTIFPHWIHRIHYRCDACHDAIFEMKKGAAVVTMDMIEKGEACGVCHNGDVAFSSDFVNCARCHYKPVE